MTSTAAVVLAAFIGFLVGIGVCWVVFLWAAKDVYR